MRRGGTGNARPSPYGKGGGRGAGRGGGFGSGGKGGGKNVYVGNLAWTVSWQDLKDHFKTIGPVLNADVMQEADGRSKGCGLVTFQNKRDADRAIAELHDTELDGRNIFVREDRDAPGGGKGGGGIGSSNTVYVGNLSYHTSWQDLKDLCKEVGTVLHADVMMEDDGRSKGCGLVKFATASEARRAIAELHDTELDGRKIFVREDRETAGGPGCKLYVGNLSPGTTWMDLKDLFREAVRARTLNTHTPHAHAHAHGTHTHTHVCMYMHQQHHPSRLGLSRGNVFRMRMRHESMMRLRARRAPSCARR